MCCQIAKTCLIFSLFYVWNPIFSSTVNCNVLSRKRVPFWSRQFASKLKIHVWFLEHKKLSLSFKLLLFSTNFNFNFETTRFNAESRLLINYEYRFAFIRHEIISFKVLSFVWLISLQTKKIFSFIFPTSVMISNIQFILPYMLRLLFVYQQA